MQIRNMAAAVALSACVVPMAFAQSGQAEAQKPDAPKVKNGKQRLSPEKSKQAQAALAIKLEEARALRDEATAVTKKIGELASTGNLPQDQAGIQTMQQLVDQLKQINERMTRIEEEVGGIQGWIEGHNKELPTLTKDVSNLNRSKWGNYVQFQYRDSDRAGENDGFRMRRVRLGLTQTIDPKTSIKVSFDLAGSQFGSTINEPIDTAAQLRDAFVTYKVSEAEEGVGTYLVGGRQPLPLGYEIERSSSEREFPERAQYNQVMFPGERSTGVKAVHGTGPNTLVQVGAFNALTYNDPQQRTVGGPVSSRLAATAGFRYFTNKLNVGVTGLFGERAEQANDDRTIVNEADDRRFIYVDGTYLFNPKLFLRTEWMWGHDRLPNARATAGNDARDMDGGQIHLGYNVDYRNQINLRREWFDQDSDASGDMFTGWGIAWNHWLNRGVRLTAAYEQFDDKARDTDWHVTTLRVQFKF